MNGKTKGKKFVLLALCFALVCVLTVATAARAKPRTDVDAYIERGYDFSKLKSLYLWPVDASAVPDSVALSLPSRIDSWIEAALQSKHMRVPLLFRDTKVVWQNVQLLYGATDFKDPFESDKAEQYFYSHLDGACNIVLNVTLSLTTERKWQDPVTETYTTTERVHSRERRRNNKGKYEEIDIWTDIPVVKERVIPGYWYVVSRSKCGMELYDTKNLNGKYIAAAHVTGYDTGGDGSRSVLENLTRKTVEDAIASIFYKKK
ncbi:hypothetical protein FACS1894187_08650 [Synergistales bacterium]|nr:hypothetical protein FACS1894187_08650 [Synergistales bacterium]